MTFYSSENSFFKLGVFGETASKYSLREWNLRNERERNSAEEVQIKSIYDPEIVSLPNKKASTELFITAGMIMTRSPKTSSYGSRLEQRSETITAELHATTDVVNKMTEKDKKTPEGTPRSPKAKYRPVLHSDFDDSFSDKLPPATPRCGWLLIT